MSNIKLAGIILIIFSTCRCYSQGDSMFVFSQKHTELFLTQTSRKIDIYTKRVNSKTLKTLVRLSKWEEKIKVILSRHNSELAAQLFNENTASFSKLLAQYRNAENELGQLRASYDKYRDELQVQLKYLDSQRNFIADKHRQLMAKVKEQSVLLQNEEVKNEWFQKQIKERRQQLINAAVRILGKNKLLQKMNKEGWYYVETLKNYKQLFSEPGKAERTAKEVLNKIPAFKSYMQRNSILATLFGNPQTTTTPQSLYGLQTRAAINNLIQSNIAVGGPNAMAGIRENLQKAQSEIAELKNKFLRSNGGTSDTELPNFKPNTQKTKTFLQRLEYGFNLQFDKHNNLMPATANMALTMGYKLNDKSVMGIGVGYKLGLGSIDHIKFTHEGISLRSYLDWKLKKQFFVSGGFEMNHYKNFKNFRGIQNSTLWQQSFLIGISRKIPMKTKFSKGIKLQVLYDMFKLKNESGKNGIVFRMGYDL